MKLNVFSLFKSNANAVKEAVQPAVQKTAEAVETVVPEIVVPQFTKAINATPILNDLNSSEAIKKLNNVNAEKLYNSFGEYKNKFNQYKNQVAELKELNAPQNLYPKTPRGLKAVQQEGTYPELTSGNLEAIQNLKTKRTAAKFIKNQKALLSQHIEDTHAIYNYAIEGSTSSKYVRHTLSDPNICASLIDAEALTGKIHKHGQHTAAVKFVNNNLLEVIAKGGKSQKRADILLNKFAARLKNNDFDPSEFPNLIRTIGKTGNEEQIKRLADTLQDMLSTNKNRENLETALQGVRLIAKEGGLTPELMSIPKRIITDKSLSTSTKKLAVSTLSFKEGQYDYIKKALETINANNSTYQYEEVASLFRSALKDGKLNEFKKLLAEESSHTTGKFYSAFTGLESELSAAEQNILKSKVLQEYILNPEMQKNLTANERIYLKMTFQQIQQ